MHAEGEDQLRTRLLQGLAESIHRRGYLDTTISDIVRLAHTSKRSFYDRYDTKLDCFLDLFRTATDELIVMIRAAVDPDADWRDQVKAAVAVYLCSIENRPAITLSWVRELPTIGRAVRPAQRRSFDELAGLLTEITANPGFRRAGLDPVSPVAATILLGGLRELAAQSVEDGIALEGLVEQAAAAAMALIEDASPSPIEPPETPAGTPAR